MGRLLKKAVCLSHISSENYRSDTAVPQWKGSRSWKSKEKTLVDGLIEGSDLTAFLLYIHWYLAAGKWCRYIWGCFGASLMPCIIWNVKVGGEKIISELFATCFGFACKESWKMFSEPYFLPTSPLLAILSVSILLFSYLCWKTSCRHQHQRSFRIYLDVLALEQRLLSLISVNKKYKTLELLITVEILG